MRFYGSLRGFSAGLGVVGAKPDSLFLHFFICPSAAAALKAEMSHSKVEPMQGDDDLINEDEAAEILEAMLGLAPAAEAEIAPKKRRRTSQKVRI